MIYRRIKLHVPTINMFMIYRCIKLYIPRSNSSLITALTPTVKENFRKAAMLLFYILQKRFFNKSCVFFEHVLPCLIPGHEVIADSVLRAS